MLPRGSIQILADTLELGASPAASSGAVRRITFRVHSNSPHGFRVLLVGVAPPQAQSEPQLQADVHLIGHDVESRRIHLSPAGRAVLFDTDGPLATDEYLDIALDFQASVDFTTPPGVYQYEFRVQLETR